MQSNKADFVLLDFLLFCLVNIRDFPNIIVIRDKKIEEIFFWKFFFKQFVNSIFHKKNSIELEVETFSIGKKMSTSVENFLTFNDNSFPGKFIIIQNFEHLADHEQIRFKSIMDKCAIHSRFFFICQKIDYIHESIISRSLCIRSEENVFHTECESLKKNNFINFKHFFCFKIYKKKQRDLLFFCHLYKKLKKKINKFLSRHEFLSNELYFLLLELFKFYKKKSKKYSIRFLSDKLLINIRNILNFLNAKIR